MCRARWVIAFLFILFAFQARSQTKHTQEFHKSHPEAFTLFFYKSTIRMLDPTNSDDYFNMIKDIEKAKFLRLDEASVSEAELNQFIASIKEDSFEEGVTMRKQGAVANVFIRDAEGEKSGLIFIMKSEGQVFLLDIVGKVEMANLMELTQKINLFESIF